MTDKRRHECSLEEAETTSECQMRCQVGLGNKGISLGGHIKEASRPGTVPGGLCERFTKQAFGASPHTGMPSLITPWIAFAIRILVIRSHTVCTDGFDLVL
jgi:hypothetical protein